jgi:hypothetical protein
MRNAPSTPFEVGRYAAYVAVRPFIEVPERRNR